MGPVSWALCLAEQPPPLPHVYSCICLSLPGAPRAGRGHIFLSPQPKAGPHTERGVGEAAHALSSDFRSRPSCASGVCLLTPQRCVLPAHKGLTHRVPRWCWLLNEGPVLPARPPEAERGSPACRAASSRTFRARASAHAGSWRGCPYSHIMDLSICSFIQSFNKHLLDAVCSVPSPVEGLKCAETIRSCHALGSPQPRPDLSSAGKMGPVEAVPKHRCAWWVGEGGSTEEET